MGDQLVVHEPGPVHRLHHPTDRFAIYGHPPREAIQAVTIRDRREPIDQLPRIGDQAHVNSFATQVQTNMQHEHSSSPARGQARSILPTAYLDRLVGSLSRTARPARIAPRAPHPCSSVRRADLLPPAATPPRWGAGLHRIPKRVSVGAVHTLGTPEASSSVGL